MFVLHRRPKLQRRYEVKALDYSPDGRYLLAGIERRPRDAWDLAGEGRLLRFDLHDPMAEPAELVGRGFVDACWSPDQSRVVAVTGSDVTLATPDLARVNRISLDYASAAVFDPSGMRLVVVLSRFSGGGAFETGLDGWQPLELLQCAADGISLAFSADRLAVGYRDAIGFGPDWKSLARVRQDGWIHRLEFSPDGRLLAAASGWRVVLWDVAGRKLQRGHELRGHEKAVTDLAFTPDGRLLLTSSLDRTIRMWDPATGEQVASSDWESGAARSVACHPDGTTAAVGGSHRASVVLFDLP